MKKSILSLTALMLLVLSGSLSAQIIPTVSVQGTNATVRWTNTPGELYLVHYRRAFHPDTNLQWTVIGTNVSGGPGFETLFQHTGGVTLVPAGVGGGGSGGGGTPGSPSAATFAALSTSTVMDQQQSVPPAFPALPDEKALEKWLKDMLKEYERQQREGGGVQAFSALMTSSITAAQATSNSMGFYAVSRSSDDSDGDGIPDGYEAQHGLNPLLHDSMLDKDGDGWLNLDEYLLGMNPFVPDPGPSTFAVTVTASAASETGPTPGTFTVSRTGDTTRAVTVYLGWGGTARSGKDYTRLTNEITFAAGQTNYVLTVMPVNDAEFEGPETVKLTLYPDLAYAVGANTEATLTIADNDLPGVSVVATKPDAAEAGPTPGEFEFRRTGSTASNLTVNFNLTGSTATAVADYNSIGTSVTILAGANATNVPITVVNDVAFEGGETVVINISDNPASYSVSNRTATVTIADNDLPIVTVTATTPNARESGSVAGQFTFSRTGSTAAPLRVDYGIGGTATSGADYQSITNFVTIPAGLPSTTLTITPIADGVVEFLEYVTLTVRGSDLYDIGAANSATVLIDDSHTNTYGWRTLRSAAINTNNPVINVPAIVEIYRTGSVLGSASFPFTVNANPTNYSVTNANGAISGTNVSFAIGRTNVLIEIRPKIPTSLSGVSFAIPAITEGAGAQIHFLASPYYVTNLVWTTNEISENGGLLTLRASRQVLGPAVSIPILISGLAVPAGNLGADHNQSSTPMLTIPTGALTGDLTVTAVNDGSAEGWESVVAAVNAFSPGAAPAAIWRRMSFIRESVADTSFLTDSDTDGDGLPDRWEIQYGYDPTIADDVTLDTDKDGLNLLDEFIFGTNPTNAVSSGTNDYRFSRVTNTVDAVPIRLVVGDTGKHNNGMGCAVCHTTGLQVGSTRLRSFDRASNTDRVVNFEKGKSYPVRLLDLLGILPPVTANTATPSNTARYTAQILPVDTNAPTFIVTDPQGILGTNKLWTAGVFTNTNATVIVPKLQLAWTHLGDSLPIETNTVPGTNTPMPGGGFRIFVGAKTPTETNPRNTVILKVKSIPPLPGRTVYLKSFDVDDATDETYDIDRATSAPAIDTNGLAGNDNFPDYLGTPLPGAFGSGTQATNSAVLDANGEVLVQFRVGMQPGNNYRIAVTLQAANNLASLQVTSPTNAFFVAGGINTVTNFNGDVSPMLTVWRKLHLEFDSMPAIPLTGSEKNFTEGSILGHDTRGVPAGQTRVYLNAPQINDRNRFVAGKLFIAGIPTGLQVVANGHGEVVVQGTFSTNMATRSVTLVDDDDDGLVIIGATPLPLNGAGGRIIFTAQRLFTNAFIQLVDANAVGLNPRQLLPFARNQVPLDTFGQSLFDDSFDLVTSVGSDTFWAHLVSFGYQPDTGQDGDPDGEPPLYGGTPKAFARVPLVPKPAFGYSIIFVESVRELWKASVTDSVTGALSSGNTNEATKRYWDFLVGDIAHEITHSPGRQSEDGDHAEGGMIESEVIDMGPNYFFPRTVKRFRTSIKWQ